MNDFAIFLSVSAKEYLAKLVNSDKAVNLSLKPSGCSGYAYSLNIVEKKDDNLILMGIPFEIKEEDKSMLNNLTIDFKKDGLNQKIVFDNPQAFNHCGCGESFGIRK